MKYIFILLFCSLGTLYAQSIAPSKSIDGAYTTLFEERGVSGASNNKLIQLVENNGTQMLAVATCEQCFPAVYTYNKELSEQFGKAIFNNNMGFYAISYDSESFAIVMLSTTADENFSYYNFYSKSKSKVSAMTTEKIDAYSIKLLDLL